MTSDENVKKIARFLENGGTMLANHCETCGAPLFRFKGEIICPLCSGIETDASASASKSVASASKSAASPKQADRKTKREQPPAQVKDIIERTERVSYSDDGERLKELILLKITEVAEEMQNETDPRRIFENIMRDIDHRIVNVIILAVVWEKQVYNLPDFLKQVFFGGVGTVNDHIINTYSPV